MTFDPEQSGREERLVELLLGLGRNDVGNAAEELAALRSDPRLEESARETEAIVRATQHLADQDSTELTPLRESRLVGRILSRTTREDLSWRGDWNLWRRFLLERFHNSNALRVVAASLLVHLLALPFFGTQIFKSPEKPVVLKFEPADSASLEPPAQEPFEPLTETGSSVASIDNALRRGRYLLSRTSPLQVPAREALEGAPLEIRLLGERSHGLGTNGAEGEVSHWVKEAEELESADALQTALWAEVLLDGYCLRNEQPAGLAFVLSRLASFADQANGSSPALESLVDLALSRASSYGLWEGSEDFDPEQAAMPFQASWSAPLGEILELRTGVRWAWTAPWRR